MQLAVIATQLSSTLAQVQALTGQLQTDLAQATEMREQAAADLAAAEQSRAASLAVSDNHRMLLAGTIDSLTKRSAEVMERVADLDQRTGALAAAATEHRDLIQRAAGVSQANRDVIASMVSSEAQGIRDDMEIKLSIIAGAAGVTEEAVSMAVDRMVLDPVRSVVRVSKNALYRVRAIWDKSALIDLKTDEQSRTAADLAGMGKDLGGGRVIDRRRES